MQGTLRGEELGSRGGLWFIDYRGGLWFIDYRGDQV
jgi:hypothetical protein